MNHVIVPVILAGGSGTRLWPLSRQSYPKQFVPLLGDTSLFNATVDRLALVSDLAPIVVCNEEHRFLVAEQLRLSNIEDAAILLEPVGRNTAPAIALAAHSALQNHDDPLILVAPSDHLIRSVDVFQQAVADGAQLAAAGQLVTFGIQPTRPDTGYGYIKQRASDPHAIEQFVEKPDAPTAEAFLASGDYLWNSGIFLMKASVFLAELERHAPAIHAAVAKASADTKPDGVFIRPEKTAFESCPSDSIDYAVLEKTDAVAVMPMACDWSDMGSWDSIWNESEGDTNGNVLQGDVRVLDSANCYVRSMTRLVTAIGCNDMIIVDTPDAVLVAPRDKAQEIKPLVESLRAERRTELNTHARVFRPWGDYEGIDVGDRYQVKRIVVRPGAKLSLQKHHHRAEHWVVVKGTAIVTCGQTETMLTENQSTYIPLGEVHRLENPGSIPLELIEVQSGSYLGEDDIVRFDDIYGRDS